jgi:NAD(P)-dependent dehydrogenase (short-subunit alcohol dehydrogenase family)
MTTTPTSAPSASALNHKVAIVTGGSRGLGRGIVEALSGKGARVIALARDAKALAAVAEQTPGVEPVAGDAADEATAERLLRAHSPDVLVLCAGASPVLGSFYEQTWEEFSSNWHVDTKSAFVWLRQALRLPMKPGSHIIVVGSGASVKGSPVSGGYAGAKRTQWFLADYAATEIERSGLGLRIHCLLPNLNPSTELGRAGIAAYAQRAGVTPEEFAKRFGAPLTPEIMGAGVSELLEAPERWTQLAVRIGGNGLFALT